MTMGPNYCWNYWFVPLPGGPVTPFHCDYEVVDAAHDRTMGESIGE